MIWPFTIFERHSVDNPTDEEPAVLTSGIAGTTGLGVAQTVPAVQAAIRAIAKAVVRPGMAIVEIADDETEVSLRSHQVAQLLANQPDDRQPPFDQIRDLVATVRIHNAAGCSVNDQRAMRRARYLMQETITQLGNSPRSWRPKGFGYLPVRLTRQS